jgi:hypothetical protein
MHDQSAETALAAPSNHTWLGDLTHYQEHVPRLGLRGHSTPLPVKLLGETIGRADLAELSVANSLGFALPWTPVAPDRAGCLAFADRDPR